MPSWERIVRRMVLVYLPGGMFVPRLATACIKADDFQIPLYAIFKIWSNFVGPMLGQSSDNSSSAGTGEKETLSKRQEKLRKRSERGDPRARVIHK
jgi:hypothetical protein